jgi:hypothetical protein
MLSKMNCRQHIFLRASVICAFLLGGIDCRAQCKPSDPVGRFEGLATSTQAGRLDISLNLLCANGQFAGTLNTPIGLYPVTGGSFEEGRLKLKFAIDQNEITIEARVDGSSLTGTFISGDDKGPVQLQRIGEPRPISVNAGNLSLTPQQWVEDLSYFTRELPMRHPDAFAHTSRDKFEAAAAELERKIGGLNSDEIYIGLDHLANLIGDAHTYVEFPDDDAYLGLEIRHFGGELRIVAVTAGYERALGTRVLTLGHTGTAQARELAASITPIAETDALNLSRIDGFLAKGMVLHGLGITRDRNSARYILATDDGEQLSVDFKALAPEQQPNWVYAATQIPLSEQPVNGSASCSYLRAPRTLYCNFRKIRDLVEPSKAMLDILKREHPDKVVIDLRQNEGGDFNVGLKYLIEPLRKEKDINQRGHLFVLIGANTFSAAMSNAAQFRKLTHAMLVGQPIGERPNSYQEPRQFTLPNSQLVVHYSTLYYKFVDGPNNIVAPDKEITPTWEEYKNGRDSVLEWALAVKN